MPQGVAEPTSFSTMALNNPPGLCVLVVDDEPLIRWSLTETLTEHGHVVTEAADAATARRRVSDPDSRPDVVLLDFRLPDSNDLGLLRAIRRAAPDAAIILMTAYGSPELMGEAMDAGAYCVVTKPFAVDDVARLVSEAHAATEPHRTRS
jgi:DNA-binding NtrC family response regulator